MSVARAVAFTLAVSERRWLKTMAYGHKTEDQVRQRASIVLLAARGRSNARIARETGLYRRRWGYESDGCTEWGCCGGPWQAREHLEVVMLAMTRRRARGLRSLVEALDRRY